MNPPAHGLDRLPAYALFAGVLSAAGLPIYIHAPKFYFDEYGVSLATLGAALFGLRLLDVVQDPLLGWVSGALGRFRRLAIAVAGLVMAAAMVGLFAIPAPIDPVLWFALTLGLLFSSFSFLTISAYAQGVGKAERSGRIGHVRVATWRETGGLVGVCLAAIAPTALALVTPAPFTLFAWGFALATLAAVIWMQPEWQVQARQIRLAFGAILSDRGTRRLLLIAFANAAPVAVSSTLFLFFTEFRLAAPGAEGPLLLLFFLSAAISTPLWGKAAVRFGLRAALLSGMTLAVVSFGFAAFLGAGDVPPFALVCIAAGAAIGADLSLLPAAFARQVAAVGGPPAQAFGLWAFVSKLTLASAAVTVLPLLDAVGLTSGQPATAEALNMLTLLYAVVPVALKLIAILLLFTAPPMAGFMAPDRRPAVAL